MSKRLSAFLLALVLILQIASTAFAHIKEGTNGHDQWISNVLFGSKTYKKTLEKSSDEYRALSALEYAVALCVDNENDSMLGELKKMRIHGLPDSYDEIKLPGGGHHRRNSHRGWNYNEYNDGYDSERLARKELLLQTVNDVFEFKSFAGTWSLFGISKDFGYDKQCEAFAEFLYYIHILTDIDGAGMDEGFSDMIKLADPHPGEDSPDIYMEIERLMPVIFASQINNTTYTGLMNDIKLQASEAREFRADNPDLKPVYSQYQKYAMSLLEKLSSKIPSLLKNEAFFNKVFFKAEEIAA